MSDTLLTMPFAHGILQRRPLRDASTKNTFAKFQAAIEKRFERQLADFDEDEYRQLEYLKELFEFVDNVTPDSDWDEDEVPVKKRGATKRCVLYICSGASSGMLITATAAP